MMEPQARYSIVGAAVLLLVAALIAAVAWLLASGNGAPTRRYTLGFTRQSLEGLAPRSEVQMRGIRIGHVESFAFSRRQAGGVDVDVEVDASAPVRRSTRAVVDRNLVTGLASIRLVTLDEGSPLLQASGSGTPATIPEGESQLQQFSQTMSQLAQRADDTLQRIGATLSPDNRAALAETLQNLRQASRGTDALQHQAITALGAMDRAARALASTGQQAEVDLHRLTERYDAVGAQAGVSLRETAVAVQSLSAEATKAAAQARTLIADADLELRLAGPQLRSAAEAVGQTSRKLGEPRSALLGPPSSSLGPGEASR